MSSKCHTIGMQKDDTPSAFIQALKSRLRGLRDRDEQSQGEVADSLDIGKSRYQKWENRDESLPTLYYLTKLAVLYEVPLWWLVTGEPTERHLPGGTSTEPPVRRPFTRQNSQ